MMKASSHSLSPRAVRQRGVVLMVALIFLLLLTILAAGASGHSLLQQRMAGALSNASRADMAAQTTLRGVEWKLWSGAIKTADTPLLCGAGALEGSCYRYDPGNAALYGPNGTVTRFRNGTGWVTNGAATYKGSDGGTDFAAPKDGLAKNPLYIVEDLGVELPPGTSGGQRESGATGAGSSAAGASRHVYRITARATGADVNTVRVMESTFAAKGH